MKKLFFCCIICLFSYSSFAQNIFQQIKVEHWDTKKGLPTDFIRYMFQSKDGFLWLSGYSGLTRFDGVGFKIFNIRNLSLLTSDNINEIAETADSTLWICTVGSGLLSYKQGKFQQYFKNSNFLRITTQPNNQLLLFSGEDMILFDTQSKKYQQLDSLRYIKWLEEKKLVISRQMEQAGNQWAFIWEFLKLGRIIAGKYMPLTNKEGLKDELQYTDVMVDSQNRVWLGSSKGLWLWKDQKLVIVPELKEKGFNPNAGLTRLILEDRNKGIWVAYSGGVAYLAHNATQFVFAPNNYFKSVSNFNWILEDKEGNIWLSSESGVFKLSYSKFINFLNTDGDFFNSRVSSVIEVSSNQYLVFSNGKLFWAENGIVRPYQFKNQELNQLNTEVFYSFKDSKSNIWVCTANGLIKINQQGEKLFPSKVQVRYGFEDKQKKLWFGIAFKGIAFLNEKDEIQLWDLPKVNFNSWFISAIHQLQNGNWLVTSYNKGIVLIDREGNPNYFNEKNGLTTSSVFNGYQDSSGTIWLVTNAGISRWKKGKFAHINFKDSLPENSLFAFLPDEHGYVWFPSGRGLLRAKKQELDDYLDEKIKKINWQIYDDGDGMLNRQCVGARHSVITQDGKILVPTLGGLVEIDPNRLIKNPTPPSVVIHQFMWDDTVQDLSTGLFLQPGNHRFIFEYSGLSLVAPEKVQFKFRLIGYDQDWISASGDRRAFYTNLPSGTYTFKVIACNNDGVWNETGASLTFTIEPFFYETWWFRLLAVLLLIGSIVGIVRWRTYAIRQKNQLLESQVVKRTLELKEANEELNQTNEELKTTVELVENERQKSDKLLLNILPEETAQELKEKGSATPQYYEMVSVLFTDFKGFTQAVENLKPIEVIQELDFCFNRFDEIVEKYGLERIKTIGDAYMAVGGLPIANQINPIDAVRAGLEIQQFMNDLKIQREAEGKTAWQCRLGIHTGEVIAGVVGTKKFAYDIWGDTVNTASRMESSGEVGKVNISGATYQLVKDQFQCTYRGKIEAKNKGEVEMYFVEGIL